MKQRLLNKINGSFLLTKPTSFSKSSTENLLQTKPLLSSSKPITRLSRSQENLFNQHTEQFTSYLQPKQNLIIVNTTSNDPIHRQSYIELHGDEVPKPGMSLKSMA